MFLIAENIVTDPKHYFQDIVPAVSQLALSVGGVFVNEMILTSDRQPVAIDQAVFAHPPLTRIVVIHFVSKERFDQFWNSEERHSIWLKGTNYAYFFDTAVHSGSMPMQMQAPPRAAEESGEVPDMLKLGRLGLSKREAEVLYWISQGKGNADIACILNVSVGTVKKHVANIFDKLGVKTRVAAVVLATETLRSEGPPVQLIF